MFQFLSPGVISSFVQPCCVVPLRSCTSSTSAHRQYLVRSFRSPDPLRSAGQLSSKTCSSCSYQATYSPQRALIGVNEKRSTKKEGRVTITTREYGGFLKWWVSQQPWVFLRKMIILGCFGGTAIIYQVRISTTCIFWWIIAFRNPDRKPPKRPRGWNTKEGITWRYAQSIEV